jgi:EAL domain-containing protein (putative c-di-GMP-specific phosphodiesterase class I)
MKIDQSFVQDINSDQDAEAIVRTVITLARSLSLKVVVEGDETVDQFNFLKNSNVTKFNGD